MSSRRTWSAWSCSVVVTVEEDAILDSVCGLVGGLMDEVAAAADRFDPTSQLSRANQHPGTYVPVGDLTLTLVETALEAACATAGAVDPTVGTALLALGYDADIEAVRGRPQGLAQASLDTCVAGRRSSWTDVGIDRQAGQIAVPEGGLLDLGATAKAWTVDEAVRRIAAHTASPFLVSIGGDLAVHRSPEAGWRIDVAETEGGHSERITLAEGALATSSIMGRRWDDGRRHHLIDPRTGGAATGPWRTATVWAPTALAANVLSTWAMVDAPAAEEAITASEGAARLVSHAGTTDRLGWWPVEHLEAAS